MLKAESKAVFDASVKPNDVYATDVQVFGDVQEGPDGDLVDDRKLLWKLDLWLMPLM